MIAQKSGVIIHFSSVAGKQALWNLNMAYAVSKAALNSYSKALATELADKGVRVITVAPGATKTEPMIKFLNDYAISAGITPEEGMKQLMAQTGEFRWVGWPNLKRWLSLCTFWCHHPLPISPVPYMLLMAVRYL